MTPQELIASVSPRIRDLGWAFYFTPETLARGQELGLDGFRFYFLGRGGVLGDVEATVVSSAFGYFNPSLVADMWDSGRAIVSPREAGRAFMACCADFGRRHLSDIDGLAAFCDAAGSVNDAADPSALALYAAASSEPLVDDVAGRAMQLVTVLREFRGSAHLIAVRVSGLDTKTAHFIRRPGDTAMFGWSDDDAPTITAETEAKLNAAEALTDELVTPAYSVLDSAGREAFATGLDRIESALTSPG